MRLFRYISIILCILLIGFYIYHYSPHYQIIKGEIFGTYYNIKIRTDNKDHTLALKIKQHLEKINMQMSVFETDSEISNINNTKAGKMIKLSPEMGEVLKASALVHTKSGGHFDPTLGRLINLWGFGPAKKTKEPSDKEVKQVLKATGFNKLKFDRHYKTLHKSNSATSLNLSAIAKGYAVDKIAALLDKNGYTDYVVEIGGEIKAKGLRSPEGEAWTIGVKKPTRDSVENAMIVSLSNMAVATSGNYQNYYEQDGRIIAHTLSAKTGKPAVTNVLSVSVFHDSCMYADAYATAVMAAGVDKGMEFADKNKLKVIVIDTDFEPHYSKAAAAVFKD